MAVAAVPEGLPTVTTWTLSRAISRLARHKVLVRDLQAIETLGSLQFLCLDKTGTLTENKMQVAAVATPWLADPISAGEVLRLKSRSLRPIMMCAALCNDAASPTEVALRNLASSFGLRGKILRKRFERLNVQYRDHDHSYMITEHRNGHGAFKMIKGNPHEVCANASTSEQKMAFAR
ncbi:MAG: cation-transporting P-type ATPase [Bdellovibrionaceae bacterium]|nr:cation-transporting P-type ATPase [Pseudobdellovibrionaceae bacterium]